MHPSPVSPSLFHDSLCEVITVVTEGVVVTLEYKGKLEGEKEREREGERRGSRTPLWYKLEATVTGCLNMLVHLMTPAGTETTGADAVYASPLLYGLVPFMSSDMVPEFYFTLINTLGMSYTYPREVLEAFGLAPVIDLASVVGAGVPSYMTVTEPGSNQSDENDCYNEMILYEEMLDSLSPLQQREWAAFLESVLIHAASDPSVLDDLLGLMEGESQVFRLCLSEGVARALFHLVPDTDTQCVLPVYIKIAAHITVMDTVLVSRASSDTAPQYYTGGDSPGALQTPGGTPERVYRPLSCTRSLIEAGVIDAIHSWMHSVAWPRVVFPDEYEEGEEREIDDMIVDPQIESVAAACSNILWCLVEHTESRVLTRNLTMAERWLQSDLSRLRGNIKAETLCDLEQRLECLKLTDWSEDWTRAETLEAIERHPGTHMVVYLVSQLDVSSESAALTRYFLTEAEEASLSGVDDPSYAYRDTLIRESDAPLFTGLVGILADTSRNASDRADTCHLILTLLARHITPSPTGVGAGATARDAVLHHFLRLGVYEHILRYVARLRPEGDPYDNDLLKEACIWTDTVAFVCTSVTLPPGDTLRSTLVPFLASHVYLLERLLRVGSDMRELLSANAAQWLEDNGEYMEGEDAGEWCTTYAGLPDRLQSIARHLIVCLASSDTELKRAVEGSPYMREVSSDKTTQESHAAVSSPPNTDVCGHDEMFGFWDEVVPLPRLNRGGDEREGESSGDSDWSDGYY
ncbi:hypothetical protein KIPB_007614 [Kipferlia bialata]|uniref:Uncharacterized protein n=1 Tax=Kipferlia bialata TaxID=797122 RepID=A0A9K3GKP2_9EUKA|nr:hypothetical protein KIPB_007614 [Kipferlia bialata]|eukprot:g7614.t1